MREAIGAIAKKILEELDIIVAGHVICLGWNQAEIPGNISIQEIKEISEASEVRVVDSAVEQRNKELIDQTKKKMETRSEEFVEVLVGGVPAGLGSYVQWGHEARYKKSRNLMVSNQCL